MPLISAGASIIGSLIGGSSTRSAARTQANAQMAAARESRFRPYNIRTSLSQANFTNRDTAEANQALANQLGITATTFSDGTQGFIHPDTGERFLTSESASAQGDPRLQQATQNTIGAAQRASQNYADYAARSPEEAARAYYDSSTSAIQGQRALDLDRLMGGLGATGTLGYAIDDGGFNPQGIRQPVSGRANTTSMGQLAGIGGMGVVGNLVALSQPDQAQQAAPQQLASQNGLYNPIVAGAMRGFAQQDYERYQNAQTASMNQIDRLLAQSSAAWQQASGLNDIEQSALTMGANLGGRAMQSNAAQYLAGAGQTAANAERANGSQFGNLIGSLGSQLAGSQLGRQAGNAITDWARNTFGGNSTGANPLGAESGSDWSRGNVGSFSPG